MNERERQEYIARTSQPSPRVAGGEGPTGRLPASLNASRNGSKPARDNGDLLGAVALGLVAALLVVAVVLFMWTSETNGKIIRLLAWFAVGGFLVFGAVAWLMTPRPVKPKR